MEKMEQEKPEQLRDQMEGTELSDEDLEAAAGGWFVDITGDFAGEAQAHHEIYKYVDAGNAKCPQCGGTLKLPDDGFSIENGYFCHLKCEACQKEYNSYYDRVKKTFSFHPIGSW